MNVPSGCRHIRLMCCPSIELEKIREDLVHIPFPLRNVSNGQNGIHTVVASGVNGLDKEAVDFKDAEDVSVLDDALRKACAVVPHVVGLLIQREPVEGVEFHGNGCGGSMSLLHTPIHKQRFQLAHLLVFCLHESRPSSFGRMPT